MLKSIYVHLMNKFPGASVNMSENSVVAKDESGEILMAAQINGLGQMVDGQHNYGAKYALCLSPIPKDCRRIKLFKDGKIGRAEEFAVRSAAAKEMAKKHGMVVSESQLKHSKKFVTEREIDGQEEVEVRDENGNVTGKKVVNVKKKVQEHSFELVSAEKASEMEKAGA